MRNRGPQAELIELSGNFVVLSIGFGGVDGDVAVAEFGEERAEAIVHGFDATGVLLAEAARRRCRTPRRRRAWERAAVFDEIDRERREAHRAESLGVGVVRSRLGNQGTKARVVC